MCGCISHILSLYTINVVPRSMRPFDPTKVLHYECKKYWDDPEKATYRDEEIYIEYSSKVCSIKGDFDRHHSWEVIINGKVVDSCRNI